jgi:hypothetical protein
MGLKPRGPSVISCKISGLPVSNVEFYLLLFSSIVLASSLKPSKSKVKVD